MKTTVYVLQYKGQSGGWTDCSGGPFASYYAAMVDLTTRSSAVQNHAYSYRMLQRVTEPTETVLVTVAEGER